MKFKMINGNLVVENELVIPFDVDGTLVIPKQDAGGGETIEIVDPYTNKPTFRVLHVPHIKLLKNYLARGACVIVWSKNGYLWAKAVCEALNIKGVQISTKPFAHVDDQVCTKWMGEHVNIPHTDSFGQEKK